MRSKSILKVSIRQIKAARALLGWSQGDLAAAADVSIPTVKRLEAQEGPLGGRDETGMKIRSAFGVRRRRVHQRERRRAGRPIAKPAITKMARPRPWLSSPTMSGCRACRALHRRQFFILNAPSLGELAHATLLMGETIPLCGFRSKSSMKLKSLQNRINEIMIVLLSPEKVLSTQFGMNVVGIQFQSSHNRRGSMTGMKTLPPSMSGMKAKATVARFPSTLHLPS